MRHFLALLTGALLLAGCAHEATVLPLAPVAHKPEPPAPMTRLGSLWSPKSKWNDLYSGEYHTEVGDRIYVRIGRSLLAQIQRVRPTPPPQDSKPQDGSVAIGADPTGLIEATVQYKKDGGVAGIMAYAKLSFPESTVRIRITGDVREEAIDSDRVVLSENVVNLTTELSARKRETSVEDGNRSLASLPEKANEAVSSSTPSDETDAKAPQAPAPAGTAPGSPEAAKKTERGPA